MTGPSGPALAHAARALLGQLEPGQVPATTAFRFGPLKRAESRLRVAAIDGGQTVVTDLGSCGVVALRAGYSLRAAGGAHEDRLTQDAVLAVVRRAADTQWRELLQAHAWGADVAAPPTSGAQWVRAWCEQARAVAEYDAARRALRHLGPGDLLLWDGSLDAEAPHAALVSPLLEAAAREGVTVLGVAKDTSLTLGGVLPFTLELEEAARRGQAPAAFAVDVTQALGREGPFRTFGVRLDARASVYRVDVAGEAFAPALDELLSSADDVAYPGYPYPLARVHGLVHYRDDDAVDLRHRLEALVAERRGSAYSLRVFGRGRDVLALGG